MRERVRRAMRAYRPRELPLDDHRDSAVLLLLHEEAGQEYVLFQVRSASMATHSGQISLPGGTRDRRDPSLQATALREVEEEIGVPRDQVEIFGQLDDTVTRSSNYRIRPYVGAVAQGPRDFVVDAGEVHELLQVPLEFLLSPAAEGWYPAQAESGIEASRAYYYRDHVIWGATARLIGQFLEVLRGHG